ncbi:hypothetical protein BKA56DRAFT_602462 [Ilyonectria sp. MPI-CAGE-AT-0026]|nr:hypothetical protein BKA56DRAFT_602462 [Ilyonectria sp. MPI-CAGE-AT-0026]
MVSITVSRSYADLFHRQRPPLSPRARVTHSFSPPGGVSLGMVLLGDPMPLLRVIP